MPAIALTIAGSDPSGGAGIQADLKTFHHFGVYGEAVITLLTVQNTLGVSRVDTLDAELVRQQLDAVIGDIPPHAAKTGALGNAEIVSTLASLAKNFPFPLVVDPVMVSKHRARLLSRDAEEVLRTELLPHCALVTPNLDEAELLAEMTIQNLTDVEEAARRIQKFGPRAVLVKGGHLKEEPTDVLYAEGSFRRFHGQRVTTSHTHGTGCTYSAAITALLARNENLENAIVTAKQFIQRAIESSPGLGRGFGPVNHFASPCLPHKFTPEMRTDRE